MKTAILFLLLTSGYSYAQSYLMNSPEILQANKVKSMVVDNCLETAVCYRDQYDLNVCGKVAKEFPAMVSSYFLYEYDDSCQLITSYSISYSDGSDSDSIWLVRRYFEKEGIPYVVLINPLSELKKTDTMRVEDAQVQEDLIRDHTNSAEGRIVSYNTGDLFFPCGIEFRGKNHFRYTYLKNGLIDQADVYDKDQVLIISLKYTYVY